MAKCPRCQSSMLLDYSDTREGFQRMWKCICCGRELFHDVERQEEDDRLLKQVKAGTNSA